MSVLDQGKASNPQCATHPLISETSMSSSAKRNAVEERVSPGYREEDYEGSFLVRQGKRWSADWGARLPGFESWSVTVTSSALFITA